MGALAWLMVGGAACGRKIGDSCSTSVDCDPNNGTRTCDLSQPGGYCLIEGCDPRSCPEDSFCIRSFPEGLLPTCSDMSCPSCEGCADGDQACGDAKCASDQLCLMDSGTCVRRALEKRLCVQSCGSDGDCRGGYRCTPTGVAGVVALTLDPRSRPKYCAPAD